MPQTMPQKIVFSLLMAAVMVYGMEVYNLALSAGRLCGEVLANACDDLLLLGVVVIVLEAVIGGPLARKLAWRLVDPQQHRPLLVTLAVSVCTVLLMCPMMSCVATALFQQPPASRFFATWLETMARNFPMALLWQLLCAGPVVRFLFRRIFARQLAAR